MNLETRPFNALLEYLKHVKLWKTDLFIWKKQTSLQSYLDRVNI